VLGACDFAEALGAAVGPTGPLRLLLDEGETQITLRERLGTGTSTVSLFVGPEGGLADEERRAAIQAGVTPVSLGRMILRAETAGLVAATLALFLAGDLG